MDIVNNSKLLGASYQQNRTDASYWIHRLVTLDPSASVNMKSVLHVCDTFFDGDTGIYKADAGNRRIKLTDARYIWCVIDPTASIVDGGPKETLGSDAAVKYHTGSKRVDIAFKNVLDLVCILCDLFITDETTRAQVKAAIQTDSKPSRPASGISRDFISRMRTISSAVFDNEHYNSWLKTARSTLQTQGQMDRGSCKDIILHRIENDLFPMR